MQAAAALPFSLAYAHGCTGPRLKRTAFATVAEAVRQADAQRIPRTHLTLTECDPDIDGPYGPDTVGQCSLDEAAEAGYVTLAFC